MHEYLYNEDVARAGAQRYHRLFVTCAHSDSLHCGRGPCRRKRNISEAHTRHFGRLEVVGDLGVWLRRSRDFASRAEHMSFRPHWRGIEDYVVESGLL